jgi:spore germination cell wall hydrolase CwlJ-like protein
MRNALPPIRSKLLLHALVVASLSACSSVPHQEADQQPPQRSDAATSVSAQEQHCVALAMYWEARGEGDRGMQAVGSVVLNRMADHRFPNTACNVVKQGGEKPPCQFSWWCDGKSDRPTNPSLWRSALANADKLLNNRIDDETSGALFFHSTSIRAPWRRTRTATIGNHVFYR